MHIYLVGGAVRDELMGRTASDRDFAVIGATEEMFVRRFPSAKKVGNRKCIYILDGDEYSLSPFGTIQEDLVCRDLTVNAFARDMQGHVIAHPNAFADLENRLLRPVAEENFMKDPLRVIRAARFAAQFSEFQPDPSLLAVMHHVARKGLLVSIAAERVGNEVRKACGSSWPSRFFRMLLQADALLPWLAEIALSKDIPAGPLSYHDGSVFDHLLTTADALKGESLLVWMAVCHDIGKTVTEREKWPAHHRHDLLGQVLAEKVGMRLRLPRRFISAGAAAARWHMTAARYNELRTGTKVELLITLHRLNIVREMFKLVKADKGPDFLVQAERDLNLVLKVRLPERNQGLGQKSGELIHQLRCQELTGTHQKEDLSLSNQTT